jgi:uncharacterized protein with PIN domain
MIKFADLEWQPEKTRRCPRCFGPSQFKDCEDDDFKYVATLYCCVDCQKLWWEDEA